jgi:protease I
MRACGLHKLAEVACQDFAFLARRLDPVQKGGVMADQRLQGVRVAILATNGFEEPELLEPRAALEAAGMSTTLIAPQGGTIYGMEHHDKGREIRVDLELGKADPENFDAVLLPGGALNADALRIDQQAQEFVRQMDRDGRPIAVICHAPWLLVSAGLTKGRTLTSYHTIRDDIENSGAKWVDQQVIRDRNWVSSRQPTDIPEFNQAMIELFTAGRTRAKSA